MAMRKYQPRRKTHAERKYPKEYRAWQSMKARCTSGNKDAHNYADRGIFVCGAWLKSFWKFLEDVGQAPSKQHTLDRKDNNLGYCKDNCRWATYSEQNSNKRNNVNYTKEKDFRNRAGVAYAKV